MKVIITFHRKLMFDVFCFALNVALWIIVTLDKFSSLLFTTRVMFGGNLKFCLEKKRRAFLSQTVARNKKTPRKVITFPYRPSRIFLLARTAL